MKLHMEGPTSALPVLCTHKRTYMYQEINFDFSTILHLDEFNIYIFNFMKFHYLGDKFSFGEVYCRIYGLKFSLTATRQLRNFEYGYPHCNAVLAPIEVLQDA